MFQKWFDVDILAFFSLGLFWLFCEKLGNFLFEYSGHPEPPKSRCGLIMTMSLMTHAKNI